MSLYQSYLNSVDSQTSILAGIVVILLTVAYYCMKNRSVLPGPRGLPYIGLYPVLTDENLVSKLEEYKKTYGDMYSFKYTGKLYISLSSIKAMREIQLQKADCFVSRPSESNVLIQMIPNGLFAANGEPWRNLRKFFIFKFKEYGLNAVRDDLAGPVYDSLNSTIEDLKTSYKNPINIMEFLSKHCVFTMRRVLFGANWVTDEEISEMIIAFGGAFEGNAGVNFLLVGPLAKFLMNIKPSFRKTFKSAGTMKSIILKCVTRIKASMNDGVATCLVEEFYKEKNERLKRNDPSWKYFTDEALVHSLFQFVGDGIASVAAFIAGILNNLMLYPEEQEKLYSEIMEVIGPNRQPSVQDRPNMPYTNAFLNEYARTTRFLTSFPSIECTKETTVRGYRIPVGSITLLNFWSAHHDEETFEDPYKFNPSRYLSSSGKPKAESPVLFGMGKRVCTGEPYVMLQSFLFLTTIVKNFNMTSSNAKAENSFYFIVTGKLELTFNPRKAMQ